MNPRQGALRHTCIAHAAFAGTLGGTGLASGVLVITVASTVLRGSTWSRASIAATALLGWVALLVVAARAAATAPTQPDRRCITAGIAGVGAVAAVLVTGRALSINDGFGWFDILLLMTCLLPIAGSIPLGRLLAADDRLRVLANRIADPASTWLPERSGMRPIAIATVFAGLVVVVIGLAWILPQGPFGHDESVYALKARSWFSGTPDTGFGDYRPIGLPIVGWFVLQVSSSEVAFRAAAVLLSTATIAVMWLGGRVVFDTVSTTLATAVFVSTASFLRRATEFLNDVSSAGLLFATAVVIWYHFERRPNGWWIVVAAPLGAVAYYLRYGTALTLGVIAIGALIVWRDRLGAAIPQLAITATVAIACLIPHAVHATAITGRPWGILRSASTSVGGGGGGLSDYASWLPGRLAGRLGFLLITASVVYAASAIVAVARRHEGWAGEARTAGFFVGTAVVATVGLGAFTHGEPRFVYFPIMATLLVGARAIHVALRALRAPWTTVVATACTVALVVAFGAGVVRMSRSMETITDRRAVIAEAGRAVSEDAGDRSCAVRSSYQPEITWYSECATYPFTDPLPAVDPGYLVVFANGDGQPAGDELAAELARAGDSPIVVIHDLYGGVGRADVYRYPTGR